MHFVQFWCIWDRLVDLRNSVQNGPNWCKSSCHEAVSEFFSTNAPVSPHWTLNSCFGAFVLFWCIWDRLVDLRNSVQNGPNWCKSSCHEVASKFFCNQRTRSTPLDPKLMFCCILYNFSAFGTVWLSYETRCKTGRTGAKVRATKSLQKFSQ